MIVPIWVSFPLLPIHFKAKSSLFTISKATGLPLRVDEATTDLQHPSEAQVCIEVDLDFKLPDRIWTEREKRGGYWQTVVYDKIPNFCFRCRHFGHSNENHMIRSRPASPLPPNNPVPRPLQMAKDKGKEKEVIVEPRQRWTPVRRDQMRQHYASTSGDSSVPPIATTINPTVVPSTHTKSQPIAPSVVHPPVTAPAIINTVAQ